MLPPSIRLPALLSLGAQTMRGFQGTDLTGFAGHNLVAWPVQSGCLPFGSLLTTVQRQSAMRHRHFAVRPAAASAPWCRGKPTHMASRSHGQRPSLPGVFQRNVEASSHRSPLHGNKVAAQWSAVNSGGGYAVCNQIHGTGKRAQILFHFAPRPNWSFNRTFTSFAGNRLLTRALGFSLCFTKAQSTTARLAIADHILN